MKYSFRKNWLLYNLLCLVWAQTIHAAVMFRECEKQSITPKTEAITITKTKEEVRTIPLKQIAQALYKAIQEQEHRGITFDEYDRLILYKEKTMDDEKESMVGANKKVPYVDFQTISLKSQNKDGCTTTLKSTEIISGNTIYIDFAVKDDQKGQGGNAITQGFRWIKDNKTYILFAIVSVVVAYFVYKNYKTGISNVPPAIDMLSTDVNKNTFWTTPLKTAVGNNGGTNTQAQPTAKIIGSVEPSVVAVKSQQNTHTKSKSIVQNNHHGNNILSAALMFFILVMLLVATMVWLLGCRRKV